MAAGVFVGRRHELAQLTSFLDRALAGQGQICFITGNAGSGKSALVGEFARRAQEAQADLLLSAGLCNAQTGIGDPYLPFRELLALLIGDAEGQLTSRAVNLENSRRLKAFFAHSAQVLIEAGPDLVGALIPGSKLIALLGKALVEKAGWTDKLDEFARRGPAAGLVGGALAEQSRIFEQYTRVLTALAAEKPLVLVLDDLQWADRASVGLLFHLSRQIGASRILLVGIYRPADVALGRHGDRHPLESVLNEIKRYQGDVWVDLDRTVETEGRHFIDELLDTQPNRLGDAFRRALFRHTEGHPLFTIELLQHMQERGDLIADGQGRWLVGPQLDWQALPARVEGVVGERLGRLPPDLLDILAVASVEGEAFTAEVVARVQDLEGRSLVRRLSRELEERHRLVRAQGIRRLAGGRLSLYRFWHNLFQKFLYNGLDEVERAYLHEEVGLTLEALYGEQSQEVALQLVRHFEAAGIVDKALVYRCQAGEQAFARYAPHQTVEHLSHAVELAERASIPPSADLYRVRGQAYETLGEFDLALGDFTAALAASSAAGDPRAAWQALVDLGELWASRDYHQTGAHYQRALEQARALDDPALLATSLNRIGNWHMNVEQPQQALCYHQEALAIFRRLDDGRGIAETLDLFGMASTLGGDVVGSVGYYREAVEQFRKLDDRQGLASSMAAMLGSWDYLTETLVAAPLPSAEFLTIREGALEITREIRHRPGEAFALLSTSLSLGPGGDYARALESARQALQIAQEIGHRQWTAAAHCALGAIYLDVLALAQARDHLEKALVLAQEIGSLYWTRVATAFLARACTELGELEAADSVLSAVLNDDTPCETMGQRLVWCARGAWALAADDPLLAQRIADDLVATALNLSPGMVIPRLSKLRGEALAAQRRPAEAEAELQAALEAACAQKGRPLQWRIHIALGNLYQATGQAGQAEDQYLAAQQIIDELAAELPNQTQRADFLRRARAA